MPPAPAGSADRAVVRPGADPEEVADVVGGAVAASLAALELSAGERRLYQAMAQTIGRLAAARTDIVDLKLADAALAEMAEAFEVFRPFRSVRKITVFGSARTRSDHPAYAHTRAVAEAMAASDWMVVTGAGPGIMAAGMEGAGRDRSIGVNIRLPFEQGANRFIAQDPKLVEMRYFFTRKLMLVKESDGYVVLPGGFGTLDESYELLTLLQTGKAVPSPVVLLDVPGGTYWSSWLDFVDHQLVPRGLIAPEDRSLFRITDDVATAVDELLGFYRNYQGCRWVGDLLVLRLRCAPSDAELDALNEAFSDIVARGRIRRSNPLPPERSSDDHLEQPRLALRFDKLAYGRLRQLVDALNRLDQQPET